MSFDRLSVEALIARLEHVGVRVSVAEVLRARTVLARIDDANAEGFIHVCIALFAKQADDAGKVERAVREWFAHGRQRLDSPKPISFEPTVAPPRLPTTDDRWWWPPGAAFAIGIAITLAVASSRQIEPRVERPVQTVTSTRALPEPPRVPVASGNTDTVEVWVPSFEPVPTRWPEALPFGLMALLAMGTAVVCWRRRHRRPPLPPPANIRPGGPTHYFLHAPPTQSSKILSREEEDQAAWGVGRYIAHASTQNIDLELSIAATARAGGEPRPIFERPHRHYDVWLWLDTANSATTAQALTEDLDRTLTQAGLTCARADIFGCPDQLHRPDGSTTSPAELDEGREGALVLVMTDGDDLSALLDRFDTRGPTQALLRELSSWPQLAFVDFGNGRVARRLADFDLKVITPRQVIGFLAQTENGRGESVSRAEDLTAWCAAAALNPGPQDDATLLALREDLALDVSPWHLEAVRTRARAGTAEHFRWPKATRQVLLQWLTEASSRGSGRLLAHAADFWLRRLDAEAKARANTDGSDEKNSGRSIAWSGSEAAGRLALARGLVSLFVTPEPAIDALYALYRAQFAEAIRRQAEWLHPKDSAPSTTPGAVFLPWSIDEVSGHHQKLLDEMGFLPDNPLDEATFVPPGRWWMTFGLAAGLAVFAAAIGLMIGLSPPPPPFEPPDIRTDFGAKGDSPGVIASTPAFTDRLRRPSSHYRLTWTKARQPCVERREQSAIVRCGSKHADRLSRRPGYRRYAAIVMSAQTPDALLLAARLVGSGTADQVIVGERWWQESAFHFVGRDSDQLLVFGLQEPDKEEQAYLEAHGLDVARVRAPVSALRSALEPLTADDVVDRFGGGALSMIRGAPRIGPGLAKCAGPQTLDSGVMHWTCGTIPGIDGPARRGATQASMAYVVGEQATAKTWAHLLLDQGVADEVFTGRSESDLLERFYETQDKSQVLILRAEQSAAKESDLAKNIQALHQGPVVEVTDAARFKERLSHMGRYSLWEAMVDSSASSSSKPEMVLNGVTGDAKRFRLVGPAQCPYRQEDIAVSPTSTAGVALQIPFVRVCGGIFDMGEDSDAHRVRISSFWIQRHEMTYAEARALGSKRGKTEDDRQPLDGVNWNESKALCQKIEDGQLPTEAEWEYAARGW
ncbi:MAG: SUMF1/EgtB/PvdO family nonheme iron enzyme, partial [Myxococcota bacterium]